jgi:nucleosome binding factor SPN SPT16 subunit
MEANLGCKFEEIDDKNLMKGKHHQCKPVKQISSMLTTMIEEWDKVHEAVRNKILNAIGTKMGIDKCMNIPPGARPSVIMVATAVEAVMGAVHKDGRGKALDTAMEKFGITHEKVAGTEYESVDSNTGGIGAMMITGAMYLVIGFVAQRWFGRRS